ncbi:MAG: hypothetical protein IJ272_08175 [Clostridia bacterium]|nr:hypothetical protein [Clostridia bacterium]
MKNLKRQDKNGVRHASDIERKYKLGTIDYTAEEIEKLKMQIIVDSSLSTSSVHPVQNRVITNALNNKVNAEEGKELSSNDYTDEEKNKLANIDLTAINNKVDKEEGKGLSSNDYTDAEKDKLAGLTEYTLPTASSTTLGGVKVGAGLVINNGVLSATGGGAADSVDWSNVINKPTKVSEFENDANYTNANEVNSTISTALQDYVKTEKYETDLANKVDTEEGKGLSSNDFTDALLNKLNNIENNAEENVIESISVNGVVQEVSDKKVTIQVEEYTESDKEQVQANTTARHTHSNKDLLESYTQTEADLAEVVANKHTHSNKAVLDGITSDPELKINKVTSINNTNTDKQYPSAKAVFNAVQDVYSTQEQRVGTWIDGKPLYRKIIKAQCPETTKNGTNALQQVYIGDSVNISFIECAYIYFSNDETGQVNPIPYSNSSGYGVKAFISAEKYIQFYNNNINYDKNTIGVFIILYTKTTD